MLSFNLLNKKIMLCGKKKLVVDNILRNDFSSLLGLFRLKIY